MNSKGGRPSVITKATVQKLEQALRDGFSIETACYVSGVSRSTYYDHVRSNEEFSYKMALAQTWATERAKQVVIREIDKGNLKAAQWWLEKRARDDFGANPPVDSRPKPAFEEWLDGGERQAKFLNMMAHTAVALYDETGLAEA